ncbi:modification methylase NmeDIP (plasmid) [Exiguobacterium sp. N4-1P]|uniref:DNA cytosine methyltransferase n=1 Tax=Exiguobacterium sp. N4-1P TaxID=2051906 RepID=UPI000B59658F|nr:DNA cytosine methyltransferase [Exiguobacterium sp. N4-1P]ASI36894.1 modification methylase NmeDIP [Exiguobacterium sp. N4-1P]ASI37667.1 modification methylase NmeDIP [Exiguobacterium sp. N4-1P]
MNHKIFSFFSGSGFLDLGFEMGGFDIVYVNEIHKPFMECYKYSRQSLKLPTPHYGYHEGDITDLLNPDNLEGLNRAVLEQKEYGNITGFIGGPPCPDFSVGGKNRGGEGENGKLTGTYIDLICKEQPSFFLFENVKGLWRTKKHRAFYEEMKAKLHSSGYVTTERLINSLEYGVPQQRERIILIGFHKDFLDSNGYSKNLNDNNIPESQFPWKKHMKYTMDQIESIPFPSTNEFKENSESICPKGIPSELTVEHWFNLNDVLNHPNSHQYFQPRSGLAKFKVIDEGDDSKKSYKRLHRWRYSPTAAYGNNEVHLHPYKARRLSIAEALAIQSLPKDFELPQDITLSNAFKTVGNGVPYLASLGLAKTILDFLEDNHESDYRKELGNNDIAITKEPTV